MPLWCQSCQKLRIKQKPGWTITLPLPYPTPSLWTRWFNPPISEDSVCFWQHTSHFCIQWLTGFTQHAKPRDIIWANSLWSLSEVNNLERKKGEEATKERQEASGCKSGRKQDVSDLVIRCTPALIHPWWIENVSCFYRNRGGFFLIVKIKLMD